MLLRDHSNVQGIGTIGIKSVLAKEVLERMEAAFGVNFPESKGIDTMTCLKAAEAGEINSAVIVGGNLYERIADMRWWATDTAFWEVLGDPALNRSAFAADQLGTISRLYSVYCDLVLTDAHGRVVANADGQHARQLVDADFSRETWFRAALATKTGDDYAVGEVIISAHHADREVLAHSTAV
ncbi:MAG: hypothetical protein MO846_08915 [Candidatus Devosia symbiotica]|nr:hypothetical protein [Candidatus Devosia symbiotica]